MSFIIGIGVFGSVYLMPLFLAYVRGHGALDVGLTDDDLRQIDAAAPIGAAVGDRYADMSIVNR